jgi:sugar phosphate isomerase/epimerase
MRFNKPMQYMNRRSFIGRAAAAAGALAFLNSAAFGSAGFPPAMRPVGLQLYTLFGKIEDDVPGYLKKLAAMGYTNLESAFSRLPGYYGMKPTEFRKVANDNGLQWTSHHVMGTPFVPPPGVTLPPAFQKMRNLKDNAPELVAEAAEGGVKYLVAASINVSTADNVKSSIDILNKVQEDCRKSGLILAYHNHDAEFKAVEGVVPYDEFLTKLSPDIKMELDLAWVAKAGVDTIELFRKNPGRFPIWHVKDFDAEFKNLQPVGKGVIDFKKIFDNADLAGLDIPFVEHDNPPDAMASLESSINYLKTILK